MDIQHLKPYLSEELFTQVSEAVSGVSNLTLINTSEGAWLPKAKFDEERNNAKSLRATIAELTSKLKAAEEASSTVEGLQGQVEQLKQDITDRDNQLTALNRSYKIKDVLRKSDVRDADVVMKLLDLSKVEEKDGELVGISDQLESLKESSSYLFHAQQPNRGGFAGGKPPEAPSTGTDQSDNAIVNSAIRAAAGRG